MLYALLGGFLWTFTLLLPIALLLHVFPRLGAAGRSFSSWLCRAPGLDLLLTLFVAVPLITLPILLGPWALPGVVLGQWATVIAWTLLHELRHASLLKGPKLYRIHNRLVGVPRNLAALFISSLAVPTFWIIRFTEYAVYPFLVMLVRLPSYKQGEWVNVTRHKYTDLVGHDRIWCLYCDWMTGVWSLGSEMLRNIETFWCPIRFLDPTKCENCRTDFPDIEGGWASERGGVATAAAVLEQKFITEAPPSNAWFGHPVRLTVKGKALEPGVGEQAP